MEKTSMENADHGGKQKIPDPVMPPDSGRSADTQPAYANIGRYGVLDIETQKSAEEVGGWSRAGEMGVSCAVLYDAQKDDFSVYRDYEIAALMDHINSLDLVVGFNIKRFDYLVLSGYVTVSWKRIPTLDILEDVHGRLGYRLSLDHLARVSLGAQKNGDGLQALKWWKQGRLDEIIEYCKKDVEITRDLFLFGRTNGYLLFENKAGSRVRLPVNW
ncbi:MAG: ribonuclease H-like domain-containing protein, partial [Desulfobacterales bacterium]|nr:ribonuclease H-like domain-containing protein [Desulfobacterales bacterium]